MMKIKKENILYIVAILISLIFFFLGRWTAKETKIEEEIRETVSYIPAPYAVHDTIREPKPYLEYLTQIDTLYLPSEPLEVDTMKILADYFLTRHYRLDFSSDTTGTFVVEAKVNQNRLVEAVSEVRPIIRTVERERTIYKTKNIGFYGIVGTSPDFDVQKLSFGTEIKGKYILGASGIRFNDSYNYTIDLGIKF